jgi:hypothetical protein
MSITGNTPSSLLKTRYNNNGLGREEVASWKASCPTYGRALHGNFQVVA